MTRRIEAAYGGASGGRRNRRRFEEAAGAVTGDILAESGTLSARASSSTAELASSTASGRRPSSPGSRKDSRAALEAAWAVLGDGGPALDAVVEAVACLEASGDFNAGRGAVATSRGHGRDRRRGHGRARRERRGDLCGELAREPRAGRPRGHGARRAAVAAGPACRRRRRPVLRACRSCRGIRPRSPARASAPISRNGTVGAVALDARRPSRRRHLDRGPARQAARAGGRLADRRGGHLGGRRAAWPSRRPERASRSSSPASPTGSPGRLAPGRPWNRLSARALASVRARGGHGGAIVLAPDGRFAVAFDTLAMARAWRDDRDLDGPCRSGRTTRLMKAPLSPRASSLDGASGGSSPGSGREHDAVPPLRLGLVHGGVGDVDDLVEHRAVAREEGHADRGRHPLDAVAWRGQLGQDLLYGFGDPHGARPRRCRAA